MGDSKNKGELVTQSSSIIHKLCASRNVIFDIVYPQYEDILAIMREELPASSDELQLMSKDYPHTKEELSKAILTMKLKNVRTKFRKAVDAGRKSGHGRVVLLYFELCEEIWGGSPATTQIQGGVESNDLTEDQSNVPPAETESEEDPQDDGPGPSNTPTSEPTTVEQRRELLDTTLRTHRQPKMKRTLPANSQLLEIAKEDGN